ncbi:hypothetical protein D3C83_174060 [compost metagenome]
MPLAYLASSVVQSDSTSGEDIDAVRTTAVESAATGPGIAGPCSSKRSTGGVFLTATSVNGLTL